MPRSEDLEGTADNPAAVIGIDPGLRSCGWGVVTDGPQPHYVASGVIKPRATDRMERRLLTINRAVAALIAEHGVAELAVEDPFVGSLNASSALAIGQARAAALLAAAATGIEAHLYAPAAVKAAVSGYGQSDKAQVQQMVKLLLSLDSPPEPADASDALAVALCHLQNRRMRELTAKARAR
jgi:crossover junction endodeoxyribonuclease RuvC